MSREKKVLENRVLMRVGEESKMEEVGEGDESKNVKEKWKK